MNPLDKAALLYLCVMGFGAVLVVLFEAAKVVVQMIKRKA